MIQSGILYTIDTSTGTATNVPIKGARLIFKQGNTIKHQTTTNATTGAYSLDVALGKYTVELAVGSTTVILRAGQLFELKSDDNANAFQNWLYSTTADVDDTLLNSFKQIANDISDSANRAESAEKGAKQIEVNMQNNSIGDANGKWLKEGASKSDFLKTFGKYYSTDIMPYLEAGDTGLSYAKHFKTNNMGLDFANTGIDEHEFLYYEVQRNYTVIDAAVIEFKGYRGRAIYAQAYKRVDGTWTKPVVFYNQENTTIDSNGCLKRASPIVQLFDDRIEHSGFNNAPTFEKISTGVYKVTNTNGLRKGLTVGDWYIELPKDRYGQRYFNTDLERTDDGCIVRVYKPRTLYLPSGEFFPDKNDVLVEALEKVELNGALTDLKDEWRCILLRFREDQYTVANEPIFKLKGEKGRYEIYKPDIVEEIPAAEEDIALLDQRAF